jgi:cytochrome c biogenesis protein
MAAVKNFPTPFLKNSFFSIIKLVADLRLAIALLLTIALFSISGTVIEQGESQSFYQQNYPENPALFGFLSWKVILFLGLNHVYSTFWFLSILVLFALSLTTCTFTRQLPALKATKNWKFYRQVRQFQKLAFSSQIDNGNIESIEQILKKSGYKTFQENNSFYAHKGILGKVGPIIVHIAMLVIIAGAIMGILTGFVAQEMIPSGQTFEIKNIFKYGVFSSSYLPKDIAIKVNRFWIDYGANGNIEQFYSDLSVVDPDGKELDRKTIKVNEPLRYKGVTFYQTNWSIAGVKVQLNNSPIFQLPMALLKTKNTEGQIWGTWVPTKTDLSEGISLIAKDLQGTVVVYDGKGQLVSAMREGMILPINGVNVKLVELVGSTGLQIKGDPGVPLVYLGFAMLMLGVVMSYLSYSQIWILQEGNSIYIGGKTNRSQVVFEREFLQLLEKAA